MMHNNKMKGMEIPAEKISRKDAAELLGALGTLFTLCPAMLLSVQLFSAML